jgi:hypothetical protein
MLTPVTATFIRVATVLMATVALAGCGSSIEGIYSGGGNSFFERLTLKSDKKVEITFMGMTKEGTYAVEGQKVKITIGAETQIFTIDDKGCLSGGGPLGTYCKSGSGSAASTGRASNSLAGIYKAGDKNESITLEFRSGQKVHLTIAESGVKKDSADGTYDVSGDRVTITVPGGMPLALTRKGDGLEGSFEGHRVTFVKQ